MMVLPLFLKNILFTPENNRRIIKIGCPENIRSGKNDEYEKD
jgi:hypothetical protein